MFKCERFISNNSDVYIYICHVVGWQALIRRSCDGGCCNIPPPQKKVLSDLALHFDWAGQSHGDFMGFWIFLAVGDLFAASLINSNLLLSLFRSSSALCLSPSPVWFSAWTSQSSPSSPSFQFRLKIRSPNPKIVIRWFYLSTTNNKKLN